MAESIKYWSKVGKRILYVILAIIGLFLGFKCAIFYMPFLIAFFISTIMEPAIRFLMKKFNFTRRFSSIIMFIITFGIIIARTYFWNNNLSIRISKFTTNFKQLHRKSLHNNAGNVR